VLGTARAPLPFGRDGTESTVDATPAPDPPERVIAYAAEVLRQHTPDRDGWCRGCLDLWGRLVFIDECTQARWAAAVHAAYVQERHDGPPSATSD